VIFVDSSFWGALLMRRDDHHRAAARLLETHGEEPLLTSNVVRGETWTLIRSRDGHRAATRFLDLLGRTPRVEVLTVDAPLEEEALTWLRRHDERAYSFADATSFALMRKRRIGSALAFDADFSAAGFVELRP
jgi:predicted nucleic acid-binding protein